ncbi:hypothetical protein JHFBIEKO_0459 [Methylobacterium mesophilicum]|jgi:hypothetical protein|nr:hypothetical protein FV233_04620 [Methylobacterium sp. WL7]GJE20036.1 hypothetical protein JHFBIEKO_0459 [Methylobacterium mesophilicum]
MNSHRTRITAGAAIGVILLPLAVPTAARSHPAPRFTQPDVPSLAAINHPLASRTSRDVRSPAVEREHLRAQRVISRVCSGC